MRPSDPPEDPKARAEEAVKPSAPARPGNRTDLRACQLADQQLWKLLLGGARQKGEQS